MGFFKEFREFALKGNVVDLAVGVIIGGAFGTIVNSLIKDVIMPVVGIAGNVDFSNAYVGLNETVRAAMAAAPATQPLGLEDARKIGPVLAYGSFITTVINFFILALCIFLMIKLMNETRKRFEREQAAEPTPPPAPPAPPAPTPQEVLLAEIRDILKSR